MIDDRARENGGPAAPAGTGEPVLALAGVSAGYGTATVLREVSLRVGPGEIVAVLGSNGAGKTTLLRTAIGTIAASAGRIALDGLEITRRPPHWRARHGLCHIPEGRGIFRGLTVEENLRLQADPKTGTGVAVERAAEVFPVLRDRMKAVAGSLSGGQQQMLALARACVTDPKVILIDEVSMGLAPIAVDEIFAALRGLVRTGVAMVLVEQYVSRALEMADTAVLLRKGQVSYAGPAGRLDEQAVLRDYLGVEP
jgi:branched-chain amino acid transport system ATP-binding protein